MKKVILSITFTLACIALAAQPPMGGRGGRPQGVPGGGRPPMHQDRNKEQGAMITGLSEIPDLTLKQREKLSKEITNERKDISKLAQKKEELRIDSENPGLSEKDRQKLIAKIAETDEDIRKKEEKYDKKYRSILSTEQYQAFSEKKKNIQFMKHRQPGDRDGRRMSPPQFDGERHHPDMPEEDMF